MSLQRIADVLKLKLNGTLFKSQSNLDIVGGRNITLVQTEADNLTTVTVTAGKAGVWGFFGEFWSTGSQVATDKVSSYTFQTRTGGKLPKAASDAAGIASRVERLIGEVNFVASPQDTFGFIQSLEASPAVDALGSVRMDWDDKAKKLSVRLMAEAWVTAGKAKP